MRFFNPLAVAFAVDTVISVNRIFLSVIGGRKPTDIEIEQRIGRQDIARYEKMMREEPGRYWSSPEMQTAYWDAIQRSTASPAPVAPAVPPLPVGEPAPAAAAPVEPRSDAA